MRFLNEAISDKQRSEIDFSRFETERSFKVNPKSIQSWTVDNETGTYLLLLKSQSPGHGGKTFGLVCNGVYTVFSANCEFIKEACGQVELIWYITKGAHLRRSQVELMDRNKCRRCVEDASKIIPEALKAHGLYYKTSEFSKVTVKSEE